MSVVAPGAKAKNHKPRWHFGIRSRSPPMEVMLEIYRTLQSLGMEWRKKTPPPDNNIVDEKGRKDHSAEEKYAQGLFFVETRCRIRDVVVSLLLGLDCLGVQP
jgi:carbon catabolite-derepressing protein kinase